MVSSGGKDETNIISCIAVGVLTDLGYASNHKFYRDKTIHMIVGFSAGGGFDIYSRVIARHMPKNIPTSTSLNA